MKNAEVTCCCPTISKSSESRISFAIFKSIDSVSVAIALTLLGISLLSKIQFQDTLSFVIKSYLHLWPYLMISFLCSAYLKATNMEHLMASVFMRRPRSAIVAASFFGALTPLCSFGVIPLVSVLLRARVALGVVLAFWLSSPIISPGAYFLTAGVLDFQFANFRLLSALFVGLFSGFLTLKMETLGSIKDPMSKQLLKLEVEVPASGSLRPEWYFWRFRERRTKFIETFLRSALFFTKWLTLAFILESIMVNHLPKDMLKHVLGSNNIFAIPIAALLGVPMYLNGTAAVPLIKLLLDSGVAPGAAMSFLVGGAVTSIPAILAVFPMVRRGVFLWYLTLSLVGSVIAGYLYQGYLNIVGS